MSETDNRSYNLNDARVSVKIHSQSLNLHLPPSLCLETQWPQEKHIELFAISVLNGFKTSDIKIREA